MRKIALLVLFSLILGGCCNINKETVGQPNLVTHIIADYQKGALVFHREYSNSEKVRSVLNYLRLLNTYGPPEEPPEGGKLSRIRITIHFSDSTNKVYEQWADQYLRIDGGPWSLLDPQQGQELYLLLTMMESD